jgi:hypothetical protein
MFNKILVSLILVGLVFAGITYVYFDQVIRRGIEIAGASALGTPVTVSGASLSLLTGSGTVRGLSIANVDGYESPYAIALETLDFQVALPSLFTDLIEITSIEVTGAQMNYETRVVTDNILDLLDRLPSATAAPVVEASPNAAPPGKRFIIRELVIQRPQITLYTELARAPISLPDVRVRNIGVDDEALTAPEVARRVLAALNSAMLFEGIPDMRTLLDSTGQQLREGASAVGDAVGGAVQSLGSGLRGLLDREPDNADYAAGTAPR